MWKCQKCSEELENSFDACWSCGEARSNLTSNAEVEIARNSVVKRNKKQRLQEDPSIPLAELLSSADVAAAEKETKSLLVKIALAFLVVVGLMALRIQTAVEPDSPARSIESQLIAIEKSQTSTLQPTGELAEIFNVPSDSTDLQRENKLKEIGGMIVKWHLPVYEVASFGNNYKIQTYSNGSKEKLVRTFIVISPRSDNDRLLIEKIKTGDWITFKGKINSKTTLRSLEIEPAILVDE
jgi:hypothetical protein